MTRLWRIAEDYPEALVGEYDRAANPSRFLLKQGVPLGAWTVALRFRFRGRAKRLRRYDDLANTARVPLVSKRLADLLRQHAAGDVELLPAALEAHDATVSEYMVVNATATVRAVDFGQSEFSLIRGTHAILSFKRLVLVRDCLGEHSLARCAEYHSFLLVAESLAHVMLASSMRGVRVMLPEEW